VRDISVGARTLVVNKGGNDGLVEGQVVIDAGGALVGRIQTVDPTAAKILLISDFTAVVVGKEVKSGVVGTVRLHQRTAPDDWRGRGPGRSQDTERPAGGHGGEFLACTNDTSPYPPGLLIGTITSVTSDPNAVVQSATVAPAAHLTDATFLLVITDYKGGFGLPCRRLARRPRAAPPALGVQSSPAARQARRGQPSLAHPQARSPSAQPCALIAGRGRPAEQRSSPVNLIRFQPRCHEADTHGARVKGLVLAGGTATRLFPLTSSPTSISCRSTTGR